MAEVIIRPEASADIANIYAYSTQKFGVDVAREYHAGLQSAIMRLAPFPEIGTIYPGLRPPVRLVEEFGGYCTCHRNSATVIPRPTVRQSATSHAERSMVGFRGKVRRHRNCKYFWGDSGWGMARRG